MGLVSWIIMGLLVGALAKWIMPGDDHPSGCFTTLLLGMVGAFLGGYMGSVAGFGSVTGFNLGSIGLALGGALLVLFGFRLLKKS
ncbi:MAG: GlsB/YeaQ/YmgE family stress response membrane protein [Gammaproteobacteria bacterium]|nr:GlsB/YeaQ/YmgE family stress response membrane protein [Gammaproteobacteria bacterium]